MNFSDDDDGFWAFATGLLAMAASSASVWLAAWPFA